MIAAPVTVTKLKQAWIVAVVAGVWGGLHALIQTLCLLVALDFASGMLIAITRGELSSDASFRGMARKAMQFILVGAAHVYNATQPLGFDAGAAIAGFFCATELISITENAGRLGVPMPKILTRAIARLRREMHDDCP